MSSSDTLTASDFLAVQSALESEAALALPFAIDECTFAKGAQTQGVFSCVSCSSIGVCYGCMVQCHTRHEVVDVGERRSFVCECGESQECCLKKARPTRTTTNKHNHNFTGTFCFCNKNYNVDTEDKDSFMLQCLLCQDWFHDKCIGTNCPDEDAFDEFICKLCVQANPFLKEYRSLTDYLVFVGEDDTEAAVESAVTTPRKKRKAAASSNVNTPIGDLVEIAADDTDILSTPAKRMRVHATLDSTPHSPTAQVTAPVDSSRAEPLTCKLSQPIETIAPPPINEPTHLYCFHGWRDDLCRCHNCLSFYETNTLSHLLHTPNPSTSTDSSTLLRPDTDAHKSLLESGFEALNKIPRVKAIEGLHAYERLAAFSKEYLKKFADEGKVVTREDVEEMFRELKRQEYVLGREDGGVE
ncbi:hypothetical protein HDU98_007424 [Podochytrium sp. JEL0797]|nr:hypothetical protein HDU98_007424 [Podochytrium sp. JEL0797]